MTFALPVGRCRGTGLHLGLLGAWLLGPPVLRMTRHLGAETAFRVCWP